MVTLLYRHQLCYVCTEIREYYQWVSGSNKMELYDELKWYVSCCLTHEATLLASVLLIPLRPLGLHARD